MKATSHHQEPEFSYTERDFQELQTLAEKHAGITLADNRRHLVYSRVVRRVRARGLPNVEAYCALLRAGDRSELERFIHAITTHVTQFFREPEQLDALAEIARREWTKSRQAPVQLWSAGCSSGEEVYSIAMVLSDALGKRSAAQLRIRGTDVDRRSIDAARRAVYDLAAVEKVDPRFRRFLLRGTGLNRGLVRVSPRLGELVEFAVGNLNAPWPERRYDAIFCRNVMIYFEPAQVQQLLCRFAQHLQPGGHLFIGHSENIGAARRLFDSCGRNIFRIHEGRLQP